MSIIQIYTASGTAYEYNSCVLEARVPAFSLQWRSACIVLNVPVLVVLLC
jgi:hypothetical protein